MPHPSSWYNDRFVAKIVVNNLKKPVDATLEKIKNARDRFELRQSRFARSLGFGGNDTAVKKLSSNGEKAVKRTTVRKPYRKCALWWPQMSSEIGQLIAVKAQRLTFESLLNFKINAVTFGTLRFQK